ncbi:MAG: AI-2E family transporter [Bradymonadia bacterium]
MSASEQPSPDQPSSDQRQKRYLYTLAKVALIFIGISVTLSAVALLQQTLTLLLIAFFIAYLLHPALSALEARGLGRTTAVWLVLGGALLVFGVLVLLVLPAIATDIASMGRTLPARFAEFCNQIPQWLETELGMTVSGDFRALLDELGRDSQAELPELAKQGSRIFGSLVKGTAGLAGLVGNLVLIPLLAFYLMRDYRSVNRQLFTEFVPPQYREGALKRLGRADEVLGGFVRGQLTVASVLAGLYTIGLWISGVPLAFVIGPLAGFANLVPFLGVAVGVGLSALVMLLEGSGNLVWIGAGVTFGVVQVLESFVLTPRIVGEKVGLSPFGVIVALAAFGEAFGFVGVLLAVPTAAVLKTLWPDVRTLWRRQLGFAEEAESAPEDGAEPAAEGEA